MKNHFPTLPQNIAEFYNLNVGNIDFEQRESRTSCDDQFIMLDIVLANGDEFPTCEENTRYQWFVDGTFVAMRDRPRYGYAIPEAEIPTSDTQTPVSHTVRVEIEKFDRNTGLWVQVADVSDTYFINYIDPPFDCDGTTLGKVKVDKNVSTDLLLYPNPAKTEVTVQSPTAIQNIEITNSLGQIVFEKKVETRKEQVPTYNLSKGIYFVKVLLEDNSTQIKKLIIN